MGEPTTNPDAPIAGPGRRAMAWAWRHPLLVVAITSGAVAIGHGVWLWQHRHLGALDPDESGYIATALRYHRLIGSDPLALPRAVGGTATGPLVPLLSVPLLWLGPDDVRTVLLAQPLLMVVTAVAGAGIARRLAGPGAAIVAGTVFASLPTVVFAAQTYWLGLGAAAFLALAIWALVASDRLTNRWTWAYGAAVGAMLLCRTMTVGYLPAVALAGIVIAGGERRSWLGLVKAGATTLVVAGPWWFVARGPIFDYLFSYGYGKRSRLFGEGGPPERLAHRIDTIALGAGKGVTIYWLVLLASVVVVVLLGRRPWPARVRESLAIAVAVAAGVAALASTSNNGVWFELPVIALLVPLAVASAAAAPRAVRVAGLVPVLAIGALQLACAWWLIAPGPDPVPGIAPVHRVAQYEYGFEQYDTRFSPTRRDEAPRAAAEWWGLSQDVERELRRLSPDGQTVFSMSGNFEMFNSNTVGLAGELRGWTPRISVPETVGGRSVRARVLTPGATDDSGRPVRDQRGRQVERVLVLALHDQHLFTPDAQVARLYREALATGWRVTDRFAIPRGGDVVILRHREDG